MIGWQNPHTIQIHSLALVRPKYCLFAQFEIMRPPKYLPLPPSLLRSSHTPQRADWSPSISFPIQQKSGTTIAVAREPSDFPGIVTHVMIRRNRLPGLMPTDWLVHLSHSGLVSMLKRTPPPPGGGG